MAVQEWVGITSTAYQKIMLFNDKENPLMSTKPGEKLDCEVYEAYAYVVKKTGKVVIGLVPKVQFVANMNTHPELAGEYVINNIKSVRENEKGEATEYLIDHRQFVTLDFLNHIIDLNRPDVLDPQAIYGNRITYKDVIKQWITNGWATSDQAQSSLQADVSDDVDPHLVDIVLKSAGYRAKLSEWRQSEWITEDEAIEFARSGRPVKTLDDELSFRVALTK